MPRYYLPIRCSLEAHYTYSAVKKRVDPNNFDKTTYDVWRWDIFKKRWKRVYAHRGYTKRDDAVKAAENINDDLYCTMVDQENLHPPSFTFNEEVCL
jgi:hypothetical protein